MDLRRVRGWDWVAGAAGAALIGVMFMHWYGSATAWDSFAVVDLFLLLAGLIGISLPLAAATQRTGAIPQALASIGILPIVVGLVLLVFRIADPPGSGGSRGIGLWLGLAALLALFGATWRAMRDQRLPGIPAHEVELLPMPEPKAGGTAG